MRIRDRTDRAAGQTAVNKSTGRWQETAGLGAEQLGGILAWPASRQQLSGQTRIDKQEFAPLVHQRTPDREHLLV
jgi:hypothetical protein